MPENSPHYNIPLHDIKPLLEVQEYSFYYLVAIILVAILLVVGVLYLLYRWFQKRDTFNIRKEHFNALNSLDFKDSKKSAYLITLYATTFKDDSPRHLEMYTNLVGRLEEFKYKKEVQPFDAEVLGYIELYKGMIDA